MRTLLLSVFLFGCGVAPLPILNPPGVPCASDAECADPDLDAVGAYTGGSYCMGKCQQWIGLKCWLGTMSCIDFGNDWICGECK